MNRLRTGLLVAGSAIALAAIGIVAWRFGSQESTTANPSPTSSPPHELAQQSIEIPSVSAGHALQHFEIQDEELIHELTSALQNYAPDILIDKTLNRFDFHQVIKTLTTSKTADSVSVAAVMLRNHKIDLALRAVQACLDYSSTHQSTEVSTMIGRTALVLVSQHRLGDAVDLIQKLSLTSNDLRQKYDIQQALAESYFGLSEWEKSAACFSLCFYMLHQEHDATFASTAYENIDAFASSAAILSDAYDIFPNSKNIEQGLMHARLNMITHLSHALLDKVRDRIERGQSAEWVGIELENKANDSYGVGGIHTDSDYTTIIKLVEAWTQSHHTPTTYLVASRAYATIVVVDAYGFMHHNSSNITKMIGYLNNAQQDYPCFARSGVVWLEQLKRVQQAIIENVNHASDSLEEKSVPPLNLNWLWESPC